MKRSQYGNTFRVTGPLWGGHTGHLWIPHTKGQLCRVLFFFSLMPAWTSCWTINLPVVLDAMVLTGMYHVHDFITVLSHCFTNNNTIDSLFAIDIILNFLSTKTYILGVVSFLLSIIFYVIYESLLFFSLPIHLVMIVKLCTLSYHHQIGSMNHYPLFKVRSWNNGMRCMSCCVLIETSFHA